MSSSLDLRAYKCDFSYAVAFESHFLLKQDSAIVRFMGMIVALFKDLTSLVLQYLILIFSEYGLQLFKARLAASGSKCIRLAVSGRGWSLSQYVSPRTQ